MRKKPVSWFAAVLLLSLLLSVGAATAAPEDHTAPLDTGYEKVGEVTVDGETYDVYRYDNLLPHASGYEVFVDGERVNERRTVERVGRAYGWETAAREELTEEEIERLRSTGRTAKGVGTVISAPFTAVDTALSLVDELKDRRVPVVNVSAWDLATTASPRLGTAESLLRTVRDGLEGWQERLGDTGEDVERATDAIETLRNGEEPEAGYEGLPGVFENATEGLREAEDASNALRSDLEEASGLSNDVAVEVSDARVVGDELNSSFRSLANSLGRAADRVEMFEENARASRESLEAVSSRGSSEARSVKTGWWRRATAEERVYGTLVLLILLVAGGGYAYTRREYILRRVRDDENS